MKKLTLSLLTCLIFSFTNIAAPQELRTILEDSIIRVETTEGWGQGIIISADGKEVGKGREGAALTAYHVVKGSEFFKIQYKDGQRAKQCRVLAYNEQYDIALIYVWVPNTINPVRISNTDIKAGDRVKFFGKQIREGVASPSTNPTLIFSDLILVAGESGGLVTNDKNELVGVISGGWFWFEDGKTTWPARASNTGPIRKLIKTFKN